MESPKGFEKSLELGSKGRKLKRWKVSINRFVRYRLITRVGGSEWKTRSLGERVNDLEPVYWLGYSSKSLSQILVLIMSIFGERRILAKSLKVSGSPF